MTGPRYKITDGVTFCEDCGAVVGIITTGGYRAGSVEAHTRYHSIESGWAWTLAVLKTAHIAAHVHDKYDAVERIDSKQFDSWTNDALAEVTGENTP